jgi:hypothetical protein
MIIKAFVLVLFLVGFGLIVNNGTSLIRIVKDEAYVPSLIAPEFHADYIKENYDRIINSDETVSFVKKEGVN